MVRVHQLRSFHLLISVIISTDLTIILLIPEKNVVFSQYVVKEIQYAKNALLCPVTFCTIQANMLF